MSHHFIGHLVARAVGQFACGLFSTIPGRAGERTRWSIGVPLALSGLAVSGLALSGTALADPPTFVKDGQERVATPWAAKGMTRNPVSLTLDWQGNVYVAESDRAGNAVQDTRQIGHLNAVEEDLQMKSVEDRRAQIKRWVAQGAFAPDYFSKTEERVRVLRDTGGKGVADWAGVFAGGFNNELDGIGAGVLWRNETLYYTCIPNLWALKPGADPFVAQTRDSLSFGYGVRWCFYGHDLHGLVNGPDGRIYFSMGDRGYNVTTKEGKHLVGSDRGGVFRCWPDGTGLELFYDGLRNPQELAFDEMGELFTGDNNCDSGDRARVVHVVEGGDSGWRQDVQSLPSRGPWNREAMWKTLKDVSGPARPAWSLPPVEYLGDGPSGMALYPGTGESRAYDGCLFLVDFYGSGAKVHSFRCVPRGAGFTLADHQEFYRGTTVTDIAWGYDGRLYLSDWGGGWQPNPNGNVFTITNKSVHADAGEAAAIQQVRAMFKAGFASRPEAELLELLGHRDQRARLEAQYELAKRGHAVVDRLAAIASSKEARIVKRVHAMWALGQIARADDSAAAALRSLLDDGDTEVRAQALKVLGDVGGKESTAGSARYVSLLEDLSERTRMYAAIALGKLGNSSSVEVLLAALEKNNNADLVLRNGLVYALTMIGERSAGVADAIASRASGLNAAGRLGAVVVLRRLNHEAVGRFLNDADATVAVEAARAVYDNRVKSGMTVLASLLDKPIEVERAIEPLLRRAIEANVLVGTDECAARLVAFAARAEIAPEWRELALDVVEAWDRPLKREGVWGNWANLPGRSVAAAADAVKSRIEAVLESAKEMPGVLARARRLQARHASTVADVSAQILDDKIASDDRVALLDELSRRSPEAAASSSKALLSTDTRGVLRGKAEEILAKSSPAEAVEFLAKSAGSGDVVDRQRAVKILGSISTPEAGHALSALTDRLQAGLLGGAVALDVYEAAMKLPAESETRRAVAPFGVAPNRPAGYSGGLLRNGGDAFLGREIFLHHGSAECVRCHVVGDTGGNAGPNLSAVASRLTADKLVESIVEPNAVVAPGYGAVSTMLPMAQFLSAREVRDVVAYLRTLKGSPKAVVEASHTPTKAVEANAQAEGSSSGFAWLAMLPISIVLVSVWRGMTARRS